MPYVLLDGKGKKVGLYSSCADVIYAQAEILLMAEKVKLDYPDAFVVGFADSQVQMTVEHFLEPHKKFPEDLQKLEEFRSEIKAKGMHSFVVREFVDNIETFLKCKPDLQISRSIDTLVNQLADFRLGGDDGKLGEMVEDIFANPLHAGVHMDFPATVADEMWISDAAKSIRRITPERWLRRLLVVMRFYFKGKPKVELPHKNDRCPCGSSKKYGKCCGMGVEHEDPENCKLGKHEYSVWQKVEGKYVRSCERCYRVYDAPWFEESVFEGVKTTVIGCRACGQKPTADEVHKEIGTSIAWHTCAKCQKPFTLEALLLEHAWADGKHAGRWVATEIIHKEESVDLESKALGKGVFLHKDCFMKVVPAWPMVAKPLGDAVLKDEIRRDITPVSTPTG